MGLVDLPTFAKKTINFKQVHRLHLSGHSPFFSIHPNLSLGSCSITSCPGTLWEKRFLCRNFSTHTLQNLILQVSAKDRLRGISGWVNHQDQVVVSTINKKNIDIIHKQATVGLPLWVFDCMMTCYLMLMGKMSSITWYSKLAKKTHCYYFITISAAVACPSNTGWWMLISLTNADDFTALELGAASS